MTPVPEAAPAPDFWARSQRGWHVAFYAVVAVTAAGAALDADDGSGGSGVLTALLALGWLVLLYAAVGARLLDSGEEEDLRPALYGAGFLVGLLVLQAGVGTGLLGPMLFVLFPQAWAMARRRTAVAVVVVVPLALALGDAGHRGWGAEALRDALLTSTIQSAVAVVLGLWITGIARESQGRAELLAELERTRADLAATEHARGVLAERQRMAGEIHDTLAQGFTSLVALAQAADAALDADPALARRRLHLMEDTARENLAEARAIVAALAPPALADDRLAGALARLVHRFTEETGVPVDLSVEPDLPDLAPEAEVVLLRAAQEGLSNVRQHARARTASVSLALGDGLVELQVVDDGVGVPAQQAPHGYGLAAMAARAEQAGGSLQRAAAPGGGTVLRVRLPLAAPAGDLLTGGASPVGAR